MGGQPDPGGLFLVLGAPKTNFTAGSAILFGAKPRYHNAFSQGQSI